MGTPTYILPCRQSNLPRLQLVPDLELGGWDLSREKEMCGGDNLGVEKIDVKDVEMASVFTQANYMCNEWLMNHY